MRRALVPGLVAGLLLSGCSADRTPPAPQLGGVHATSTPVTEITAPFHIRRNGETKLVYGHSITLEMPSAWEGLHQSLNEYQGAWEYAVAQPRHTKPFPAYVHFLMGIPDFSPTYPDLVRDRRWAEQYGEPAPTMRMLEKGPADIPGAARAHYVRYRLSYERGAGLGRFEQLVLYLETQDGVASTILFVAPGDRWERVFKQVYDSLRVAPSSSPRAGASP